jgi:hypothetical protein
MRDSFAKLGPLVKQLRDDIPKFSDVLNVGATAMKFLADHSDALRKALPYLAAGFILVKTAQVASNAAAAVAPAFRIAEYFATKNLTRSNLELAASYACERRYNRVSTPVENVSMLTRIRSTAVDGSAKGCDAGSVGCNESMGRYSSGFRRRAE